MKHLLRSRAEDSLQSSMESTMFQEGWVMVNGVPSHTMTWGGWVEEPLPGRTVLIFLCGVPGITLFYQQFLDSLYHLLQMPIWTVCIAGHELPPTSSKLRLTDEKLYNSVAAQTAYKRAFFEKYVAKDKNICLVAHSFGTKMAMELLKDEELSSRVVGCALLMPTLERFGATPRARFWLKMSRYGLLYLLIFWFWVMSLMPFWLHRLFCFLYFRLRGMRNVPQCCQDAMLAFFHPTVFYNVRTLVWDEVDAIQQLDTDVLTRMKDKIKVYFAPEDYWAPITHYESLRLAVPELRIQLLDNSIAHAFTLQTATHMAHILANDLKAYQDDNVHGNHNKY